VVVADFNEHNPEEMICLFADRIRQPYPLADMPLVVLTRSSPTPKPGATPTKRDSERDRERIEGCKALAGMSRNSIFLIADSGLHELHVDQPQIVVKAIRAVVDSARDGSKLRPFK
jgi:hypothetical protein